MEAISLGKYSPNPFYDSAQATRLSAFDRKIRTYVKNT